MTTIAPRSDVLLARAAPILRQAGSARRSRRCGTAAFAGGSSARYCHRPAGRRSRSGRRGWSCGCTAVACSWPWPAVRSSCRCSFSGGGSRVANAISLNEVILNDSRVLGPAVGGRARPGRLHGCARRRGRHVDLVHRARQRLRAAGVGAPAERPDDGHLVDGVAGDEPAHRPGDGGSSRCVGAASGPGRCRRRRGTRGHGRLADAAPTTPQDLSRSRFYTVAGHADSLLPGEVDT
jgi:hypothetical protein